MPRRVTLTDRQKDALLRLPTSQTDLLKHYTLSDEDFGHIRLRRRAHNRFGFALQLCVLRYPGRVLAPGELIPAEVIEFIGAQLGLDADGFALPVELREVVQPQAAAEPTREGIEPGVGEELQHEIPALEDHPAGVPENDSEAQPFIEGGGGIEIS